MATSMITGAALLAATSAAHAADATAAAAASSTNVGEVVITGSRIPSPNLTSVSPVTAVNSGDIKLQGTQNVEDLIDNLPQAFGDFGNYESNGASGTATVDLRGLGNKRTLVLINGTRLQPGDPQIAIAPDLNMIPTPLIDRIEVLTGGASAVYGSDAVAGVVNFIMKKDFEGVQIDEETSIAQDDGGNQQVRTANANGVRSLGFPSINFPGATWDGLKQTVTGLIGLNAPDEKGNMEAYFSYTHIEPILQGNRDYSKCSLATNNTSTTFQYCGGSTTDATGRLNLQGLTVNGIPGPPAQAHQGWDILLPPNGNLLQHFSLGQAYNYAPLNYFQRPDERWTAGQFSNYKFNDMFDVYSSMMFMDDHTVAQIAGSGSFWIVSGSSVGVPVES